MAITRKNSKKAQRPAPKASKAPAHKPSASKKAEKTLKKTKKAEKTSKKSPKQVSKPSSSSKSKTQKTVSPPARSKPTPAPALKPKRQVEKKPPGSSYIGYTTDQYNKYVEYKNKLSEKNNNELKEICRKNGQKVTGTKDELVERIADGKVLGAIPKCQSCGGGRPKWDAKSGTYRCPGYMEDSDFVRCNKLFTASDITRSDWQD